MSVRYEWHENPTVSFVAAGTDNGTMVPDEDVLVISGGECAAISGDLDQFVRRVLIAMHRPDQGPAYRPAVFYRLLYHGSPVHSGWDRAEIDQVLKGRIDNGFTPENHKIESRLRWTITSPWKEVRS